MRLTLILLAISLSLDVGAQPSIALRQSCSDCRIEFRQVIEFQSEWEGGGLPTRPVAVHRFARTHWIVVDAEAGLIHRFDAQGRYVAPLSRKGAGPAEFHDPSLILPWGGDSIAIFDGANARTSVFAPSGRLARTQRWEAGSVLRAMRTTQGDFVLAGSFETRMGFGMPFHRFARSGVLLESFGAASDARVVRGSDVPTYRTPSVASADESFWAVDARSPVLRRFRVGGEVIDEWTLPFSRFETFTTRKAGGAHGGEFFTIEQIDSRFLLVGMIQADPRSAEALGAPRLVDGMRVTTVDDWGRYVNTRFLLLDTQRRELVAAMEEDGYIAGSLGDRMYWGIRPGGDGGRLVVLQAVITHPRP